MHKKDSIRYIIIKEVRTLDYIPTYDFSMTIRLNRILDDVQIDQIHRTIFCNQPITVLRTIARTGRNNSSVSWVYLQHNITLTRTATFISFDELLNNFFIWLDTIELMAIALFQRSALNEAIYLILDEEDRVYSCQHGWGIIVKKERTEFKKLPRFWLELDEYIASVEPCTVQI